MNPTEIKMINAEVVLIKNKVKMRKFLYLFFLHLLLFGFGFGIIKNPRIQF
jgi:hypothetical protein